MLNRPMTITCPFTSAFGAGRPGLGLMLGLTLAGGVPPALATSPGPDPMAAPIPMTQLSPGLGSSEAAVRGDRIYRSVTAEGRVVFGDRPEPGAREASATQFMSYSSPQALARAQQEREYWRLQADALRRRQAQREQAEAQIRQLREQERAWAQARAQYEPVYVWRPAVGLRNFPPAPITGVPQVFSGSPGLVHTRPPGFLTSGTLLTR